MYEPTTYDLLDERIKTLHLQKRMKEKIEFEINNLKYKIDTLLIELQELDEDIRHSEDRSKELEQILRNEGIDDKKVRQFVRDANIRAARGF